MTAKFSVPKATWTQAQAHLWAWKNHFKHTILSSRFLSYTIAVFLIFYMLAAYTLVSQGLVFVSRIPLIGSIFVERMLFLLFFFFFLMLIVSNATIAGVSLFRRQETSWQLSLPLPHASLVVWRTIEGLMLSSWGLLLLSAPILIAFGQVMHADYRFYLIAFPCLVGLIAIASNISTWLLLLVVRFYRPWWLKVVGAGFMIVAASILLTMRMERHTKFSGTDVASNVNQILRQTEVCTPPLPPSSWLTEALLKSQDGQWHLSLLFTALLLSYAIIVWYATAWLGKKLFYRTWNAAQFRSEIHSVRSNQTSLRRRVNRRGWMDYLGLSRSTQALVRRDVLTFLREPMQWGQCALIFGMLILYSTNIKNMGYDFNNPFWTAVISYLNVLVCALALSTLTTRFLFPQISLEGQRLWITGLAPISFTKVLHTKLVLNSLAALPITLYLVFIASHSLSLPSHRITFFLFAVVLLTFGLHAMALGVGTLLPNLKEQNAAKIVSGFGGTLCLMMSFLYIVVCMGLLIWPTYWEHQHRATATLEAVLNWQWLCAAGLLVATLLIPGIPYALAVKKAKRLANLAVNNY